MSEIPIVIDNIINRCQKPNRVDESSVMFADFDYGCSLTQTSANGWIMTGPIVLNTDLADLSFLVLPGGRPYAFIDTAGNVIPSPVPGEAFFIRVPATSETYMLTLYAYEDNCAPPVNGNPETVAMRAMMRDMATVSGRAPAPFDEDGLLPDCYTIYAKLAFYINQRPVACRRKPCVTMPGQVAGTGSAGIYVGCCKCGCR